MKIRLSHTEVEHKLFLEVLGVYVVLVLIVTGLYYLNPSIIGYIIVSKDYNNADGINSSFKSDEIISTMSFLFLLSIFFLLTFKFISFARKNRTIFPKNIRRFHAKRKKFIIMRKMHVTIKEKKRLNVKNAIKRAVEGKSKKFAKCYKLILKIDELLHEGDIPGAKISYSKALDMYKKLEYWEKKEVYKKLGSLYKKIVKLRK